jgi:hypothetical protein
LHAATLVTAGIYLLLRCSPILEYSPTALLVITIVGASTAFFAATCGLVANDLKRIIAMSTISQLGYYKYYKPLFTTLLRSQYNPCILRCYIAKTSLRLCEALRSGKFKGLPSLALARRYAE